jgi:predicted hotdog family 3-hydroxylacyl-ACP dehydratase
MRMTREQIAGLIPHGDAMCLLDGVVQWDADHILCTSCSHRAAGNPLRVAGRLPALCAIEYAAQAMAVHGGLAGKVGSRPRAGYLASLRDVECSRESLDDLAGDLFVEVRRVADDGVHVIYRFTLRVGEVQVLRGQAMVVLDTAGAAA